MRIAQINVVSGKGSTGKICVGISKLLNEQGIDNRIFYSFGSDEYQYAYKYSNDKYIKFQALKSRVLGNYGFNSKSATNKLIKYLKEYQPHIVHIHNIHGHDCDLELLFTYLKSENIKIVWTFHDCWAFTGYCTYFTMCYCDKWQTGCKNCPQKGKYSWFFDRSSTLWQKKKELLSGVDLTIVTPSKWLASLVKVSFFRDYPIEVINNGIDLSIFHPAESDFRKKNACEDKFLLLGVSFEWEVRKGLDVFIELAKRLDSKYKIVLVGTNDEVDKLLPSNIISIHRTNNQRELVEIYSTVDLFVNPTREENFPTVNIESLACGTPVLTFDTGGSPEIIDENCGSVVENNDIDTLELKLRDICTSNMFSCNTCLNRASIFDADTRLGEYLELYKRIM
ncbi:MAG: glycosyltransferase [Clostridiales bacterium]|jgi:putative colanic acid biosynthesis glycosyltransferase|nr:glycosyltransferase [Clostridiales bacterium]